MISVFTPTNDPKFIRDCHRSLLEQDYKDFEWVILKNGSVGDITFDPDRDTSFIRIIEADPNLSGIGAFKRAACAATVGDILLELDHDDWLMPTCLSEVAEAFANNPTASLVYSDFAYMNEDGSPSDMMYQGRWSYDTVHAYNKLYHKCNGQRPTPENVGVIWYAPNHVRAFARWAYEQVGGYDPTLSFLDDQDIMIKLYKVGEFIHLPRMLYLQRMHSNNTQHHHFINNQIQIKTVEMYEKHIDELYDAWAKRELEKARLITPPVV